MRICGMWLIVCLARGRTMCVFLFFFLFAYNMFCVFNCWSYRNVREMREIFVWGGTKGIWFVCFIIWTIATDLLSNLHLHFMINDHSKWTLEFARIEKEMLRRFDRFDFFIGDTPIVPKLDLKHSGEMQECKCQCD